MARRKIVAGNWKMNLNLSDALKLVKEINDRSNEISKSELIIFPPAPYLFSINKILSKSVAMGVQNCHQEDFGAYTGEISLKMVRDLGVKYVLVGHSERRKYFRESNQTTALKIDKAIENNIIPILCCGETLEQRNNETQLEIVGKQVSEALFHLDAKKLNNVIIAYEPVWAIGTGKTATVEQAQEMHEFIRSLVKEKYNATTSHEINILYGGSCKPENAFELFRMPDIDGGLIGGASLNAADFISIAKSF